MGVSVSGSYAYVADRDGGLVILRIILPAGQQNQPQPADDIPLVSDLLGHLWLWDDVLGRFADPGLSITLNVNEPTYLLTHGWDGDLHGARSMSSVACAIREAKPEANVLAWEWADAANPNHWDDFLTLGEDDLSLLDSMSSAIEMYISIETNLWMLDAWLSGLSAQTQGQILGEALAKQIETYGSLGSEVHLIGKSHGGGVMGRAAEALEEKLGQPADSLTTLDTPKILVIDTLKHVKPESVGKAAVFYYLQTALGLNGRWGGFGAPVEPPHSNLTNLSLNPDHGDAFPSLLHLWISGYDDGDCPPDDGWFPLSVWDESQGGPVEVSFGTCPENCFESILSVSQFPSGTFNEQDLYMFSPDEESFGAEAAEAQPTGAEGLSLLSYEPFDSAVSWFGTNAVLVSGADPDDPENRVVLFQEPVDTSFFKDIDWSADGLVFTFDYMFRQPHGDESLTVYLDGEIVYYDSARTSLAIGQLTPSGAVYVGDVAGTTSRLNFVLRTDGAIGNGLILDNLRVFGTCAGTFLDCSVLDTPCTVGVCDPAQGTCVSQSVHQFMSCDDGDPCTDDDACVNGSCIGMFNPEACGVPEPIPALSERGLVGVAALLLAAGVVVMRRRRVVECVHTWVSS